MINSVKNISTSQTIPILITKLNKPKVIILIGRVMNFRIGLIKTLAKPKINPANTRVFHGPVNSTPVIN